MAANAIWENTFWLQFHNGLRLVQFAQNFARRRKIRPQWLSIVKKFLVLRIQDGGRICTKTLRTQMLQSIAIGAGAYHWVDWDWDWAWFNVSANTV